MESQLEQIIFIPLGDFLIGRESGGVPIQMKLPAIRRVIYVQFFLGWLLSWNYPRSPRLAGLGSNFRGGRNQFSELECSYIGHVDTDG